jgi:hypothetical protein
MRHSLIVGIRAGRDYRVTSLRVRPNRGVVLHVLFNEF